MQAVVDRSELDYALKWHSGTSPTHLMAARVEEDHLVIESAGEVAWKRTRLPAADCADGRAQFSSGRILEQMKTNKKATSVTVHADETWVTTRVGRSSATSPTVTEIPGWWEPPGALEDVAEVDGTALEWTLRCAEHAAARPAQQAAEVTKAARVVIEDGAITMYATDTFRLATTRVECDMTCEADFLVPPGAFIANVSAMGPEVTLVRDRENYGASSGTHSFVMRGYPGTPKDVRPLLKRAAAYHTCATVPVRELADAVSGAGAGKLGQIEITFNSGELLITNVATTEGLVGVTEVIVDGEVDEDLHGHTVRISATALIEMLKSVRTGSVSLATSPDVPRSPLVLKEADADPAGAFLGLIALVQRPADTVPTPKAA